MSKDDPIILGIESSCDDTSAAVIRGPWLLSNVTASQEVHRNYGGVVPELASRAHQQNIVPTVDEALRRAQVKREELAAIAFTRGPGLLGSLLVGVSFAKGLSVALNIPPSTRTHSGTLYQRGRKGKPSPRVPLHLSFSQWRQLTNRAR